MHVALSNGANVDQLKHQTSYIASLGLRDHTSIVYMHAALRYLISAYNDRNVAPHNILSNNIHNNI